MTRSELRVQEESSKLLAALRTAVTWENKSGQPTLGDYSAGDIVCNHPVVDLNPLIRIPVSTQQNCD
jgi:hypothetical protein